MRRLLLLALLGAVLVGCAPKECMIVSGWEASPTMVTDWTGEWCE